MVLTRLSIALQSHHQCSNIEVVDANPYLYLTCAIKDAISEESPKVTRQTGFKPRNADLPHASSSRVHLRRCTAASDAASEYMYALEVHICTYSSLTTYRHPEPIVYFDVVRADLNNILVYPSLDVPDLW